MNGLPPDLGHFFGRFHPLLVHLPIGFLVLLACLEVLACLPRCRHLTCVRGYVLALTVPATALSALCGWLLSHGGDYDTVLLDRHMWAGIGVAGACLLALIVHWLNWRTTYDVVLAATLLGLLVASHFGGSLTHGSDYLTRYLPALMKQLGAEPSTGEPATQPAVPTGAAPPDAPAYASLVQPLLAAKCVACHGPAKAKGGLRLDTLEAVLKGNSNGPIVVPGEAAASKLVRLLELPVSHDEHMPPGGKPQPSTDEIAVLQWWINGGAPADKSAAELKLPAHLQHLLPTKSTAPATAPDTKPHVKESAVPAAAKPLAEVLPVAGRLAAELGISLLPLAPSESWLQVNASLARTQFGDAELAKLAPLAPNLRCLDLTGTGVTDKGLAALATMPHLTRLHLARTAITDAGLMQLTPLAELEYLNLHGTQVTDAALERLKPLPKLRQLYLWQTNVSPTAAKTFADHSIDKDQIQRWQKEIAALTAKIKCQGITVDVGTPPTPKPVNTKCPVSDKEINLTITSMHEGKLVAFCCDKCKTAFDKDPKPYLTKLCPVPIPPQSQPVTKP